MNPLKKIEKWVLNLEVKDRSTILTAIKDCHSPYEHLRQESSFMSYLQADNLTDTEVIRRCLIVIQLINNSIYNEAYWRPKIEGDLVNPENKAFDWVLMDCSPEQKNWINLAKDWNTLLENYLVGQELIKWCSKKLELEVNKNQIN